MVRRPGIISVSLLRASTMTLSLDCGVTLLASQAVSWLSVSAAQSLDWIAALLASRVVHWLLVSAIRSLDWSAALLAQQASRASADSASHDIFALSLYDWFSAC